jgi:hypothetical protein
MLFLLLGCHSGSTRRSFINPYDPAPPNDDGAAPTDPKPPDDGGNNNGTPPDDGGNSGSKPIDWIGQLKGPLIIKYFETPDSEYAYEHLDYREKHNMQDIDEIWQYCYIELHVEPDFPFINKYVFRHFLRYFKYNADADGKYLIPFWQRELVEDYPILSRQKINGMLDWIQKCGVNWEDPNSPYRYYPDGSDPGVPGYASLIILYGEYIFIIPYDSEMDFLGNPLLRGMSMLLDYANCYHGSFTEIPWDSLSGYYDPAGM